MANSDHRMPITAVALLVMALAAPGGVSAQGLQDPDAIDTIIGSDVREEEVNAADDAERVMSAIENTGDSARKVRMTTNLDQLDIVFLADAAVTEGGPPRVIVEKIEAHADEIAALRQEIEGNALLYHAINSRRVLVRDILAIEFDDEGGAVVYAAAKQPG